MRQVLVFCNTKIGANRLAYKLDKDGVAAAAIHSDRTQGERTQALAEFKEGKHRRCWWPPMSRRADSTSNNCPSWSTSTCQARPKTTCTASAAPAAPA